MNGDTDIAPVVRDLLARAPEWIRVDLASKDVSARERAEETLAAMIVAALVKDGIATPGEAPIGDDE